MYNISMSSRKKIQDIHTYEYLKRQRLLAQKHRRYMRLRDIKISETPKEPNSKIKPKKIITTTNTFKIIFSSMWFFIKEFVLRLKTRISIFGLDIRLFLKKKYKILFNFFSKNKKPFIFPKIMPKIKRKKKSIVNGLKTKKKKKNIWGLVKSLSILIGIILIAILSVFFVWFSTLEIPSVENFENRKISNSTKIYDRTGEILLYDIHENIRRTVVDFSEINQPAKDAIVAIEDHTFYNHNGVVWKSTIRAFIQTALSRIGLSDVGTAGVEDKLTKDEILEIYLNEAPYGGTIYGIQEAAKRFFGVSASELSIAQSAYLASIPNLPTFYSPYGPNKDKLDQRQKTVLNEMRRHGFITDEQYRTASLEVVEFIPEEEGYAKSLHFVQYVRAQLEETYGVDIVQNGGLKVVTTLDYELQQKAEEIIKEHIEEVEEPYNASNAGLVAIESETGQIITMVGSRDYFDTEDFDGNFNVATAPRQPGSAFKPIAYATAFEKGYLPESTIFDTETQFNSRCEASDTTSDDGCYSPNNHDFRFKGPMTWRNALAQSRNIPAIKVNHLAGLSNVIQKARDMGISSLTKSPSFYGLGLVLGGGEVSLLEMTSAYGVLANDGIYNKPTAILEIIDLNGEVIEEYTPNEERAVSKNANSPMTKGSSISGKPWRKYMDEVLKEYKNSSFSEYSKPDNFASLPNMIRGDWYGGNTVYIDSISGKLATEFTPEETRIGIPQPDPHTILHWIDKSNPSVRNDARNDPQYKNWEYGVAQYVTKNLGSILNIKIDLPTESDDVHLANGETTLVDELVSFTIGGIKEDTVYEINEEIDIRLRGISSDDDIQLAQLFINNAFVASDESPSWGFTFVPNALSYFEENNLVRVIVTDEEGIKSSQEISFTLEL